MAKKILTKEGQFVVGEERVLNYILAALCFALFLYGVVDAVNRNFRKIDYQSFVFALALIPACLFFRKARSNRIYIRINKTGIYHDEKLVTAWANFINAYIDQKEKKSFFSIQDNFILVVEYKKDGKGFRHKIPLTNTQNKSEEDVLQAVIFFGNQYRVGITN